jgi:hypothetical protein
MVSFLVYQCGFKFRGYEGSTNNNNSNKKVTISNYVIIIQFNSCLFTCKLNSTEPITKLARVHRNTEITKNQNTNKTVYTMAIN